MSNLRPTDFSSSIIRRAIYLMLAAVAVLASAFLAGGTAPENGCGLLSAAVLPSPPIGQEPPVLEPGRVIERELAGGQKHSYQIVLSEREYASVIVEQHGIDVRVTFSGADGKPIARFDSELRIEGQEKAELVAETAGSYNLSVETKLNSAPSGRYLIRLAELRPATLNDRLVQEARKLYREAWNLFMPRTDVAKAQSLAERALQLFENAEGPEHPDVATVLALLARMHDLKSEHEIAESLLQRALEIREKAYGPEHLQVASSVGQLGLFWWKRGSYARAEALAQRELEITEKALGLEHLHVVASLNNVANFKVSAGNYAAAKPLYQRALEIREKLLGPEDLGVAKLLEELADVYTREGGFAMAESLYRRALAICERKLGPESEWASNTLTLLADAYTESGDYFNARVLYQRALEIRKKILAPGHQAIGHSLYKLGSFNFKTGDDAQAESFHLRAVALWEKNEFFGRDYPDLPLALEDLGKIYCNRGHYVRAEEAFLRALAIAEKHSGSDHPDVARIHNQLADLYRDRGEYQRAEPLYQRALTIWENANGQESPSVAVALGNLARIYLARGDVARAVEFQSRANAIDERNIPLNLATGSERWKLSYLNSLSKDRDRTISLHVRFAADNIAACRLAVSSIIQRKGRVQDAMSEGLVALRRRFSPQDRELLDRLNGTTAQLARLVLNGLEGMNPAEHRQRIKALEEQKEKIEEEISRRSAGYYQRPQPVTLSEIQPAIPSNAALIEFAVYRPFDPKAPNNKTAYGEPHYVAYVVRRQGEVQWRALGDAKAIDAAIDGWRKALRDPQRKDVQPLARAVDEKLMQSISGLLGDATQLFISPDGELNLIPLAALIDQHGRYLIERYSFTYLTSGRDLLRLQVARESKSKPLVFANPLFGEPESARTATAQHQTIKQKRLLRTRQGVMTNEHLSSLYFAPLCGTAQEARAIKSLFPEADVFTGEQATESTLKRVDAPRILHIATHGFFLQNAAGDPALAASTSVGGTRAVNPGIRVENPLLRSGLALAGANVNKTSSDDGILTALEASGLNLWGTKLVTLSACDTGLGEVKNGEGVYGLRRALVLAGAETLVMSLWPVSDYVTREMMVAYYKGLKQGQGRGEALRQVQLNMSKRKNRQHPFYWASFIQSGEWANLEGKR
ncbi:MAG TPA: CHAT domain-containing tetratricopeptide repeat protein [Acidobacteriota bacterium]